MRMKKHWRIIGNRERQKVEGKVKGEVQKRRKDCQEEKEGLRVRNHQIKNNHHNIIKEVNQLRKLVHHQKENKLEI
jgi:hypothetical protein